MGKIFGLDSPVVRFMTRVGELMLFSVLWILCCLPLVTVGAATAALFRMMFNMKEARSTRLLDFFRAFRDNFKKATVLWLILLGAAMVLLGIFALATAVGSDMLRLVLMLGLKLEEPVLRSAAEKLGGAELVELRSALRERAAEKYPIQLQLGTVRGEEALESGYLI